MALRKSPLRTPALLAANRLNARKSTGPHTPQGKARVSLNALKHGRYAVQLRKKLVAAGDWPGEALYGQIRSQIAQAFRAQDPQARREADRLATWAWCFRARRKESETEPECASIKSTKPRGSSPSRIGVKHHYRRIGLAFWVQRRRYWTRPRLERVVQSGEPAAVPAECERLEAGVHCRVFQLGRPGWREREKYGLDKEGNYSPELEAQYRPLRQGLRRPAARE